MFGQWLALPGWVILSSLALAYGLSAYAIYRACFAPGGRARFAGFAGVAPPFLSLPTLLFGLMTGFLASDIWDQARQGRRVVLEERDAAMAIENLDRATPTLQAQLDARVHAYVRAVLQDEWTSNDERGAASVRDLLQQLMADIARPEIGREVGTSVQSALLNAVTRLATARSTRLALLNTATDELKWTTVMALAFLSQVGVACVHLEKARAQLVALIVFTGAAVVVLSLIAVCEHPFSGPNEVSRAPLRAALPP